jgi:hypothetical protein
MIKWINKGIYKVDYCPNLDTLLANIQLESKVKNPYECGHGAILMNSIFLDSASSQF